MKTITLVVPFVLFAFTTCKRDPQRHERNRNSGRRAVREDRYNSGVGQCELEISCKGDTTDGTQVKLPIKGPRGPPGRQGDKGDPGEPGATGTPGSPGKSANSVYHVAFFAGLGENQGQIDENTDLVFDRIFTNIGEAYNEETGRVTAPFSGVYHFTVVVAAQGRQKAAVMLMNNGTMVETIWAESIPYWATSSNTAILNLTSGDQVWLVRLKRAPYIHGYMYSSFSGYSLFETSGDDIELDVKELDEDDDAM